MTELVTLCCPENVGCFSSDRWSDAVAAEIARSCFHFECIFDMHSLTLHDEDDDADDDNAIMMMTEEKALL